MRPLILTGWRVPEFNEPEFADLAAVESGPGQVLMPVL